MKTIQKEFRQLKIDKTSKYVTEKQHHDTSPNKEKHTFIHNNNESSADKQQCFTNMTTTSTDESDFTTNTTYHHHCQSTPDLKSHLLKKKWFSFSRINLRRQRSTPPLNRIGYGGLKPGTVEPPDPPPQLLYHLDHYFSDRETTQVSTPPSSSFTISVNRRRSLIDINKQHQESPSFSSTLSTAEEEERSTVIEQFQAKHHYNPHRRLSCPDAHEDSDKELSFMPESEDVAHNIKKNHKEEHVKSSLSSFEEQKSNVLLFDIYKPHTTKFVMSFKQLEPRTVKLRRRVHPKSETKAVLEWQYHLIKTLNEDYFKKQQGRPIIDNLPVEKRTRYTQIRKFILQEFYITEINFWNQLNYAKVMFCNPLKLALERNSPLVKASDLDWFANLDNLMDFSSTLIHRCSGKDQEEMSTAVFTSLSDDVYIGQILCSMSESMITFLRCALDYKANIKLLKQLKHNKGYILYKEKLDLRKETRQFTLDDYFIIPIQRVTRYSLLLTDLEKHTETIHPDYENIRIARCIIQSLASAMNYAQK
ncbi:Dbl homology domain-containing protein [Cokeromyces recurvatus]|uniref:Dbl homology domain-containing protein n=1 Tax=Cokeromyces recurvatus TaxID=90255 RepID=UPI0022208742|nr:Dbl homology domain-containing protein [Cokeromyces recurvatus]KAI7904414.1 Dbl homology domain-containing protein [Cokeromyces recurvatus]